MSFVNEAVIRTIHVPEVNISAYLDHAHLQAVAFCGRDSAVSWRVNGVVVTPPRERNKGLGTKVMKELLNLFVGHYPKERLVVLLPKGGYSERHRRFFGRLGFVEEDERLVWRQ